MGWSPQYEWRRRCAARWPGYKDCGLWLKELLAPNLEFVWLFLLLLYYLFNFNNPFLWSSALSDETHL
jgi:hypothetical protein